MRIAGVGRRNSYRSNVIDRALASSRTVALVGPVAGLDEDRIRAVLQAAVAAAPDSRIALNPDGDSRTWEHQSAPQMTVTKRQCDTADLGRLLTEIYNRDDRRTPLDVFICDDYLVVDYSHGLGDGFLGLTLLRTLAGGDVERAAALAKGLPSHALWTAIRRHFGSHPTKIREVLQLRRNNRGSDHGRHDGPSVGKWQAAMQCVTAHMDADTLSRVRQWASANAAGSTTASITTALWMAALRAEGASLDERVMMLVNCRRYLGAEHLDANGNFAFAIPIPLSGPPPEVSHRVRQVTESGWPLAILAVAELKAKLRRQSTSSQDGPTRASARMRLAVSDLGRLKMFDGLPWAEGQRPPQVTGYLETDDANAVALIVTELMGSRTFTASFSTELIEPALIERALRRMCTDPVGLLESAET